MHLHHHLGAAARELRYVARELDDVAEPLLGVDEDGLARERIFAEPERLAETLTPRHAGAQPARLVFREAALVVAEREQRQRLVVLDVGIVLVGGERSRIFRQRLLMAVERRQRRATADARLAVVGTHRDRALVSRQR